MKVLYWPVICVNPATSILDEALVTEVNGSQLFIYRHAS